MAFFEATGIQIHLSDGTSNSTNNSTSVFFNSLQPYEWMTFTNIVQWLGITTTFLAVTAAVIQLWTALFRKIEVSFESTVTEVPIFKRENLLNHNEQDQETFSSKEPFQVAIFCRPRRLGESVEFFMGQAATCDHGRSWLDLAKWLGRWHCRIIKANDPVLMLCHGQEADVFRLRVVIRTPAQDRNHSDQVLLADGYFSGRSPDIRIFIDRERGLTIGTKPAIRFRELEEGEEELISPVRAIPTLIRPRDQGYLKKNDYYQV
ncbi:hypothetical protein BV898_06006 [Hypsibius exemplaris]|uniref:Uncharacterized protein n=1 Tax=Hypsibius exemplaris TaxID=2072580 RepID=A0A1W0WY03_HYPEX|nr:hypothetical protein BV898_06006 [Hypsibius exemplaris]